jgi:hypothetical protein
MNKKIKAYHKIRRAIHSSKHELHLHTCTVMIRVFSLRYKDESMKALLKEEIDSKRQEMRFLATAY